MTKYMNYFKMYYTHNFSIKMKLSQSSFQQYWKLNMAHGQPNTWSASVGHNLSGSSTCGQWYHSQIVEMTRTFCLYSALKCISWQCSGYHGSKWWISILHVHCPSESSFHCGTKSMSFLGKWNLRFYFFMRGYSLFHLQHSVLYKVEEEYWRFSTTAWIVLYIYIWYLHIWRCSRHSREQTLEQSVCTCTLMGHRSLTMQCITLVSFHECKYMFGCENDWPCLKRCSAGVQTWVYSCTPTCITIYAYGIVLLVGVWYTKNIYLLGTPSKFFIIYAFRCDHLENHMSYWPQIAFMTSLGSGTSSHAMTLSYLTNLSNICEWVGLRTETSKTFINTLRWDMQCQIGFLPGWWITHTEEMVPIVFSADLISVDCMSKSHPSCFGNVIGGWRKLPCHDSFIPQQYSWVGRA